MHPLISVKQIIRLIRNRISPYQTTMSTTIKTSAGTKPVDPYKAKSFEDPPLPQKVEDLAKFIKEVKYGMLTTKLSSDSELLTSRCMALAGQVRIFHAVISQFPQSMS